MLLWFEQDFFEQLGPERELPALPRHIAQAMDQTEADRAWKYSAEWRVFIWNSEPKGDGVL